MSELPGSWTHPKITDAEEPTVVEAVTPDAVRLGFQPIGTAFSVVRLGDGTIAMSTGAISEDLAEYVGADCHVRLFGRWANVELYSPDFQHNYSPDTPDANRWPGPGRMLVIDRFEHEDCPACARRGVRSFGSADAPPPSSPSFGFDNLPPF